MPIVFTEKTEYFPQAERLAEHLGFSLVTDREEAVESVLMLMYDDDGLSLAEGKALLEKKGKGLVMRGDFTSMLPRLKHNNLSHELLIKASKIKGQELEGRTPKALDATAGMGEDSLLLAAAGFEVVLYEYNPVIAALLQDTLYRARSIPELADIVARMEVREGDSIQAMKEMAEMKSMGATEVEATPAFEKPDVILLDPMFPAREKSGLIKKKFQLLQKLERPCPDEADMLEAARKVGARKLVIKRPAKGPYLANVKPDYSIDGKSIRYDCFVQ